MMNEQEKLDFLQEVSSRDWKKQHKTEAEKQGITVSMHIYNLLRECFGEIQPKQPIKSADEANQIKNGIHIRREIKAFRNNKRVRNTLSKGWNGTIDTVCATPDDAPLTPGQFEHYSRILDECYRMDRYFKEGEQ